MSRRRKAYMTFYYQATQAAFFRRLPTYQRAYVQAALDQEWSHYKYLLQQGATPQATAFYFPPGASSTSAASPRSSPPSRPWRRASWTPTWRPPAASPSWPARWPRSPTVIVGIEAEHRVLGRELSGESLPRPTTSSRASSAATDHRPSQIIESWACMSTAA
ncbi:MAG: hypothetical protein U0641_11835 [Anaerolineae bacterium]